MKKCPFCAEEIQDEAVVCRHCGKELIETQQLHQEEDGAKKNKKKTVKIILIICAVLIILCCGIVSLTGLLSKSSDNTESVAKLETENTQEQPVSTSTSEEDDEEEPIQEVEPTQEKEPEASIIKKDVYEIGEVIELDDQLIVLNEISQIATSGMRADFIIVNTGGDPISISSLLSFEAKTSDGVKLEHEIFDCSSSTLDGSIVPGDRLAGSICWSGAIPSDGVKLYYSPSLFGSPIVFNGSKEGKVTEAIDEFVNSNISITEIGQSIKLSDHVIICNSIEKSGNLITSNFTIENTGNSDITVSSILSFDARLESGWKLEQELFGCSSSLDGTIIPGDKLTGNICWTIYSEEKVRVYYKPGLIGSTIIVWEVIQ